MEMTIFMNEKKGLRNDMTWTSITYFVVVSEIEGQKNVMDNK